MEEDSFNQTFLNKETSLIKEEYAIFQKQYQSENSKILKFIYKNEPIAFKSIKSIHENHEKHLSYLADILNFNSIETLTSKLRLLYRGSEHNFDSKKFHQACDGQGKTLVLVRSTSKNLFGGYSTTSWHSNNSWSSAPGSFLFSLDKQSKHTIYQNEENAIQGCSSYGPIFGDGYDLALYDNCHTNTNSYSNLGCTYSLPNNISYGTNEPKSYLAVAFALPETIPLEAKEVILLTFLRCGYEGPSRNFLTSIYTEDQQGKYTRYVKGARYPQSAISFNSENISLPLGIGRKIFVECEDVQKDNCHGLEIMVLGFRK